ncbi:Cof-type HAD-IIB family hydrolase [Mycoplasma sp. 'Moose RK']|uniref:Cof-type HAD-IIB family hydrolase n=1 Tax=Mycoplasma sp. 'Moose RK' TaxID=2780095 RepID=UPI001E39624F|nr:Cof-type HAD-IIB family hydrolase [Mycoplasma sp. 'Moose RK']
MDKPKIKKSDLKKELDSIENFVFDLDGTLLNSSHNISDKTAKTLFDLKQKGKKIIFCSGRPWYFIKKYYQQILPDFPIISCNGSLIYDFQQNSIIFSKTFLSENLDKIFKILTENNIIFLIYTTTNMLAFSKGKIETSWFFYLKNQQKTLGQEQKLPLEFFDYSDFSAKQVSQLKVVKFLLIKRDSDPEKFEKATQELDQISGIYLVQSQPDVVDIMISGSNKGQGLQFLAQNYQLDLQKTLVFGDAKNDLPMFAVAKFAIAMGQATQEVAKDANFVTKSNDEDGIFAFFNEYD